MLATVATTINALAFGLMSGAVASGDLITVAGGRAGSTPRPILTITDAIENSPITGTALGIWVPGHILGMVLLAVALRRARVLPRWAAVVLGVSQPIHFLAFVVLDNQYVDAFAGWGLTAVGFAAVAVALLRTRTTTGTCPRRLGSSHISVALTDPRARAAHDRVRKATFMPCRRYGGGLPDHPTRRVSMIARRRLLATTLPAAAAASAGPAAAQPRRPAVPDGTIPAGLVAWRCRRPHRAGLPGRALGGQLVRRRLRRDGPVPHGTGWGRQPVAAA